MKHIISLGAGVQSSAMALMAARGEITPMPECAIFADTGAEPQEVYDWLDYLETLLPFPVYRVSHSNLKEDSLFSGISEKDGLPYVRTLIPMFIPNKGLLNRSCTRDYKIKPIMRKCKEILGLNKADRWPTETVITQWLGISMDEIQRMKMQVDKWQDFRHPLIELEMTRGHCLEWMKDNGYPAPPRSACTFCPFHSNTEWNRLTPKEFEDAVQFERDLHRLAVPVIAAGKLQGLPYLHRDCKPLDEVDLTTPESAGQISWLDECGGACGV